MARPRSLVSSVAATVVAIGVACASADTRAAADPNKVLRIASTDITSLDPQQGTDLLSTRVAIQIFEALYQFDYLATPAKVIPCTAEAMPVIAGGGTTWTIKVQKGIHFADDPVFKGRQRELTAQDYVYRAHAGLSSVVVPPRAATANASCSMPASAAAPFRAPPRT